MGFNDDSTVLIKQVLDKPSGFDPRNFTRVDLTTSQTWVAPVAGKYIIIMQGGGGSGSGVASNSVIGNGGCGGVIASEVITLTNQENVIVTIGAGGAAVGASVGNTGGTTTFGSYMTAVGGTGGKLASGNGDKTGVQVGIRGGFYSKIITSGTNAYNSPLLQEADGICMNFYNLLHVNTTGGDSSTSNASSSTSSNVNRAGGGGAGLLSNGGSASTNSSAPAAGTGAGGGGATSTTAATRLGGAGGNGVVIIFYEAV